MKSWYGLGRLRVECFGRVKVLIAGSEAIDRAGVGKGREADSISLSIWYDFSIFPGTKPIFLA